MTAMAMLTIVHGGKRMTTMREIEAALRAYSREQIRHQAVLGVYAANVESCALWAAGALAVVTAGVVASSLLGAAPPYTGIVAGIMGIGFAALAVGAGRLASYASESIGLLSGVRSNPQLVVGTLYSACRRDDELPREMTLRALVEWWWSHQPGEVAP